MAPSRRLHVMQVVYSLCRGGSERLAYEISTRVDPARMQASVCALEFGGPLGEELTRAGIPFHVVGRRRRGFDATAALRFYEIFRAQRVDIVQTHHMMGLVYAGLGARLAGASLVHVEHEYFSFRRRKARLALRALAPLCHRIVAVADEVGAFLTNAVGLPRPRVSVIPNGVDLTQYRAHPSETRESLGLPSGHRLIGNVARLEPDKDQATLLHAFSMLPDYCADTHLVLVGSGSLENSLRDLSSRLEITGRVHFLGLRADVPDLLPHFDVFAMPSVREGLPLAVLEAMACERPVVTTAVGEIPRVIHHGASGLTVPPGDPAALARQIAALLNRPDWASALGRAARARVEANFSIERTAARYSALYEGLPTPAWMQISEPVGSASFEPPQ